jgi:hypothetical protein
MGQAAVHAETNPQDLSSIIGREGRKLAEDFGSINTHAATVKRSPALREVADIVS